MTGEVRSKEAWAELQAEYDALDARIRAYDGGDRPMSPPVWMLRQAHELWKLLLDRPKMA